MIRKEFMLISLLLVIATGLCSQPIEITLDTPRHPFPHFWERMFGSGRAILSLRDSYRRDLREVRETTGFEYVRFHAIFHDEVGVYDERPDGTPVYNFSYVDEIYDGLREQGVRPFVELSFMPKKLAARPSMHPFWYAPIVAPPKDWAKWADLVSQFAQHLVDRYGIEEVSQWYSRYGMNRTSTSGPGIPRKPPTTNSTTPLPSR